jgi:hypothetical protein
MLRKFNDVMRRIFRRRQEPVVRHNAHKPCDTCGQVSSTLIDGMCEWCNRFFGAHK